MERNRSVKGFPGGVELVEGAELEGMFDVGKGVKGVVLQKKAGSLWPWRLVIWILVSFVSLTRW